MDEKLSRTIATIGFDPRRNRGVSLLEAIAETGSINQAAKRLKISYKAAWEQVDLLNNLVDVPLLDRSVGGRGGGGTSLTAAGEELVRHYRKVEREYQRFLDFLSADMADAAEFSRLLRRLEMKVSARNVWSGKIVGCSEGSVNSQVTLQLPGGTELVATVTRESLENLGLEIGSEALAMVKSSSVMIARDVKPCQVSARNLLSGPVERLLEGPVTTEVTIALTGGGTVTGIVTNESAARLELREGVVATALIKANSLMLAVV